jgi:hypothetical protein
MEDSLDADVRLSRDATEAWTAEERQQLTQTVNLLKTMLHGSVFDIDAEMERAILFPAISENHVSAVARQLSRLAAIMKRVADLQRQAQSRASRALD